MEEKKLREKLYSLVAPLKPSQFAIEQGAKSDEQIIEGIIEDVKQELDRTREEVITEIYNFVEGESGRSGRKEILEFISKLTTK